jgi:hypothetical protein
MYVHLGFLLFLFLTGVLLLSIQKSTLQEPFGVFGCSPIPFQTLVKDMLTPAELETWKKDTWGKLTSEQKNAQIHGWDTISCERQHTLRASIVDSKKKRESVDNI